MINRMPDSEKQQFLNVVISRLKDEDASVCRYAAKALGRIGDVGAVDALIEALNDEAVGVRSNAAKALGAIGDVDALIEALKDEKVDVRSNAARALVEMGDPRAVEALKEALKDENADVRKACRGS